MSVTEQITGRRVTLTSVDGTHHELTLERERVIGRLRENDLAFLDTLISRRHCSLREGEHGVELRDLGSANGTFLNGRRIDRAVLHPGDLIEIGHVELRIAFELPPETEERPCVHCGRAIQAASGSPVCVACADVPEVILPEVNLATSLQGEGYEVVQTLSRTGQVAILEARKVALDQRVALKLLPLKGPVTRRQIERFTAGLRALAPLRHRHIVTVHDVRRTPEVIALVMELIDGETLAERIRRLGPLPLREVMLIAYQLGRALEHLSERNVVHRDVKPHNVMWTSERDVKLIDFGLALSTDASVPLQRGEVLGTLGYMAPEQLVDADAVDHRADLYGLGATLMHALSGKAPRQRSTARPAPPVQPMGGVAPEVLQILMRLLALDPAHRFPDATSLLRAIEATVTTLSGIPADARNVELLLRLDDEKAALDTPVHAYRVRPAASFQGSIRERELLEFLQLVELNRKSGTVRIASSGQPEARVRIVQGRIVSALAGERVDRNALREILDMSQGRFDFVDQDPDAVAPRRCDLSISGLLLEHLSGL